jgi:inhibitor of KinA sporulation pathway (predicted exonuclease)
MLECSRILRPFPFRAFKRNILNVKKEFWKYHKEKVATQGLASAIQVLGWTFEGRAHTAYADAYNTYRILEYMKKEGYVGN